MDYVILAWLLVLLLAATFLFNPGKQSGPKQKPENQESQNQDFGIHPLV